MSNKAKALMASLLSNFIGVCVIYILTMGSLTVGMWGVAIAIVLLSNLFYVYILSHYNTFGSFIIIPFIGTSSFVIFCVMIDVVRDTFSMNSIYGLCIAFIGLVTMIYDDIKKKEVVF